MMVPPPSAPGDRSDEKRAGSAAAARMSAWALSTQKPTPSGVCSVGACHQTGASRRKAVNTSSGKPAGEDGRGR